ncbi:MAG: tRNA glutamyl-Q(34) synthetase GluQRS [Clostridia bacterium]|nr:tRNA glutamyl-Q(34) synthetase GluQRS [Clostridia bacterium]
MSTPVVGRFAPTPSGFLHPGNLLCAMIAYLSVRTRGGRCLLRIEDLDRPRCPASLVRQCISDLNFLGFRWDGPILYQSERTSAYLAQFRRLRETGQVYPCFCSRAQLHASQAPNRGDTLYVYPGTCLTLTPTEIRQRMQEKDPAYRLHVPDISITVQDRIQGPFTADLVRNPGDFILRRADGVFAYHLAVVTDDAESGVTEVVRGCDILTATPSQIYLQQLLGFPTPVYAHIPLLVDANGRRLAKRDQAVSLSALSKVYRPDEILGALAASAGLIPEWRPCTLESLMPLFDLRRLPRTDLRLPEGFSGTSPV